MGNELIEYKIKGAVKLVRIPAERGWQFLMLCILLKPAIRALYFRLMNLKSRVPVIRWSQNNSLFMVE